MHTSLPRADFVLVAHLQATWQRAGRERLDPWLAVEREKRTFPLICQFDPTDGLYHGWLSNWRRRQWDSKGFRATLNLDQLDEVRAALARFHSLKDRLPVDQRDIGQYHRVDDLFAVVPTKIAESRRRQERESLKYAAYEQTEFLFRDGRWMVLVVKGFAAARFWGLGTKWCTTQAEHMFWRYAAGGTLMVFLTPHGKYQLATASQMFRNERDDSFDMAVFRSAPSAFLDLLRRHYGRNCRGLT